MVRKPKPQPTGKPTTSQGSAQIDEPDIPESGQQPTSEQPETPEEPESETAMDTGVAEEVPSVSGPLLEIYEAVVSAITEGVAKDAATGRVVPEDLDGFGNILGVGLSPANQDSGGSPGETVLTLYVAEATSVENAKQALLAGAGISEEAISDTPVNVVVTGIIDAQGALHRSKMRPAPAGISVGHYQITAGTIGCFARGRTPPRSNRVLILSNNHVLANSNSAHLQDNILQPGPYDGGHNPAERIAILEQFIPINFAGGTNYVDCATAWCWHRLVKYPDLMYQSGTAPVYFRVSSVPVACRIGMNVGKSGRTTQLTHGVISDCSSTIRVSYGGGKVALFSDQIAIRGVGGAFSAGGDSGSLIWTWDARRNPVGLLFAGGGGITFACKIGRVLTALNIVIRS